MIILAFETSCDDTSIAVFNDSKLLSMETKSQIKIHNITGGVVPEIAAREHANSIFETLDIALLGAKKELKEIDYIAVTVTPGLMPSLLTGISVANTLGKILEIPVIEINHIEAHIFSNFLDRNESELKFPCTCLTVSGGHNEIYYMENMFEFKKLGGTTDDSAGEAFDKVAKMMGLEYPGGPIISKLADKYTKSEIELAGNSNSKPLFPRVWLKKNEYNFSFSGLKSAVKREAEKRGELSKNDKIEISYEFQKAVIEVLAYKLVNSAENSLVKNIMLAGGVSANNLLRDEIKNLSHKKGRNFIYPKKIEYCMDNAAMVGINAYYKIRENKI